MPQNKYAELLAIIEEIGKEIRPTYAGSKSAMERLKRGKAFISSSAIRANVAACWLAHLTFPFFEGIIHARGLVRECLAETERNARS